MKVGVQGVFHVPGRTVILEVDLFVLDRSPKSFDEYIGDRAAAASQDLRNVFNAPDRHEANRLLAQLVKKYKNTAPELSNSLETDIPEGLTVSELPTTHRRRLRTTSMLERLNQEIKRRTRAATLFPNEESLLRHVSVILSEFSDDWETGKVYLTMPNNAAANGAQKRLAGFKGAAMSPFVWVNANKTTRRSRST